MISLTVLIYALLGGILPALLWLYFWLREDRKHPEPKGLVVKTFLFGMLAVILVLPFQKGVDILLPNMTVPAIFLWAVFEEVFKLAAGYFGGLHSVEDNEPLDPIIYMITAALGFVALENTLFILGPLMSGDMSQTFITGNLRFIGAGLLHVLTSGLIGVSLAFSFYKSRKIRLPILIFTLGVSISIHTIFNLLILRKGGGGTFISFVCVWAGIIALLLIFEKIKGLHRPGLKL